MPKLTVEKLALDDYAVHDDQGRRIATFHQGAASHQQPSRQLTDDQAKANAYRFAAWSEMAEAEPGSLTPRAGIMVALREFAKAHEWHMQLVGEEDSDGDAIESALEAVHRATTDLLHATDSDPATAPRQAVFDRMDASMDPPRTFPPSQGAANFAADMATGPTCPHCGAAIDITEANRGACDLCAAGGLANPQATS